MPSIADFNIIGLLDRDENSIGYELCGVKVVSLKSIRNLADVIIINSDPSNYKIIYKRIANYVNIPVYYADGSLADIKKVNADYKHNQYWDSSYEQLKDKIDDADIISFDIFDTLIMRKIFSPEDVFKLLEERVISQLKINENIALIRTNIVSKCGVYASIDDIYYEIEKSTDLPRSTIEQIKQLEKDIDMQLCIARKDIKELYEYCIKSNKEVYLISDMYYGMEDIKNILNTCGLKLLDNDHIWISCEKKMDKISGSMWKEYSQYINRKLKCLHIGDNIKSDIDNPLQYDIDTYYVMSGKDMVINSSISEIVSNVNTVSDSICLGLIIAKLFNSPFALCSSKGKIIFENSDMYGYCVYGPLFEKFLIWLYYNSRQDGIEKLLFFARDGYFLKKNYRLLSELINDGYKQEMNYFPISRRLIYIASMETEEDLKTIVEFPYVGTFAEYMFERFNIQVTNSTDEYNNQKINAVGDADKIMQWIKPYKNDIIKEAEWEKANYIKFMQNNGYLNNAVYGIVDLGYYGTNQYYLQKLTNIKTQGYCFYSCLVKDNSYLRSIDMKGCFQYGNDYSAEKSLVKKKNMFIEAFITAPHGMIRYIDDKGNIVCEKNKKSQMNFKIKQDVNEGLQHFIIDYITIYKTEIQNNHSIYLESMENRKEGLEDNLFYQALNGMCEVSENILRGFYFDNDFVGKREIKIEI